MSEKPGSILLFRSTHDGIRAEDILIKAGLRPKVIPVPRRISADCGIALIVISDETAKALECLSDANVNPTRVIDDSQI